LEWHDSWVSQSRLQRGGFGDCRLVRRAALPAAPSFTWFRSSHGYLHYFRYLTRIVVLVAKLGFIKRITASEESFKIDWLLFELLNYVRGCRLCR